MMTLDIKLHEIADLVMKKYKCIISRGQRRSAKRWALNEGENTMRDHYGYIRSYAKEILLGSTVRVGVTVNLDDQTLFDRFYVYFSGLKEGWKKGCRRVIALDGCFLKKPNFGEILVTIRRDGNNHIFPVTWVMVNVENKENWSWFLGLLGEDLDLPTRNGLTLISDQHKKFIYVQTAPTQSSQTVPIEEIPFKNQVVPVNEPIPQAKRNFVIPRERERSERILKRKLAKDHPGTRNSRTNPHSLD
ncbi:pentatricopeptide repeat-containing protein [Tanacetum coccineum]